MKIAVIADTHGRMPNVVLQDICSADEIWHLGDVCDPSVLTPLNELKAPFHVVRGNCDWCMDWPVSLRLERCGKSFFLIHIPPTGPIGADFVLHGHTHVPRDEMVEGIRFLNPGTIGKPNHGAPPSYAWLEMDTNGKMEWRNVKFQSELKTYRM